MILRAECEGKVYKWVEKNNKACLTVDETRLIWWGHADSVPFLKEVPTEVLLKFSVARLDIV